jgi:hypothetical protein
VEEAVELRTDFSVVFVGVVDAGKRFASSL